jgi:hypothetical protein
MLVRFTSDFRGVPPSITMIGWGPLPVAPNYVRSSPVCRVSLDSIIATLRSLADYDSCRTDFGRTVVF